MITPHLPIYRKDGNTLTRFSIELKCYKELWFLERIAHWVDKKKKDQSQVIQVKHLGKDYGLFQPQVEDWPKLPDSLKEQIFKEA